ncbi:MAG: LacI family DNA-binding transcriptional regulator [Elusimicrobiota bacterium]
MNLKDIAKKLRVSRWTISRVINNEKYVREYTRKKILKYLKGINYVPNYHASSLAGNKSRLICLTLPTSQVVDFDVFTGETMKNISSVLENNGYYLMIMSGGKYDSKKLIHFYETKMIGGFIIFAPSQDDMPEIRKMQRYGIPIVIVFSHDAKLDSYMSDNVQGGYMATKYLIERGREKIAFIHGHPHWVDSSDRYRGFLNALSESNVSLYSEFVANGYFSFEQGREITRKLLQMKEKPDAIFASNDKMALGAVSAAAEMKMKMPEDISIIGYDGIYEGKFNNPPLTTVMQPISDIVKAASLRLLDKVKVRKKLKPVVGLFNPVLVRRGTA